MLLKVTLGDGPDHVAMFSDSSRVYDLKKEEEVWVINWFKDGLRALGIQ